jgi:predicted small lipoprotein YifL
MKLKYLVLAVSVSLTACGTLSGPNTVTPAPVTAIQEQRLSTNFRKEGIKIDWTMTGELKSVEVTGYAPAAGNTEFEHDNAFDAAELDAKAKLVRFLREGITSSRVTNTMSKNVEKAHDKTRNKIKGGEDDVVVMSDVEAAAPAAPVAKDKDAGENNIAIRDNINQTTRTVIKKISEESNSILSGVFIKDTDIMSGGRMVKVVIRWDRDSQKAVETLRKNFR